MWCLLAAVLGGSVLAASQGPPADLPIVVDTDAGADDYIALAFLLAQPGIVIDAITVVNGLAHVDAGAKNVARLCELAGRGDIPIYVGESNPAEETAPFPDEWRNLADLLPGVDLPEARRAPERAGAVDFLASALRDSRRRRLLTLGPLTNLARALEKVPAAERRGIESVVMMGGAVGVPGNLHDGGYFKTENTAAEWNMFVDPLAAETVFASGLPLVVVPLDATSKVPLSERFVRDFAKRTTTPLGKFVSQVLEGSSDMIAKGIFFAFDPLAAVVLLHRETATLRPGHVQVLRKPPTQGRTWLVSGTKPNAEIAFDADAKVFARHFLAAFVAPGR
jgi:inosine-uridine nucleoside N-ribohydrolase